MIRQILFRGKRVDNKEWIYGYLSDHKHINQYFERISSDKKISRVIKKEIEVIPETIGQFTGMFDKHKTRIFENDICKQEQWSCGFVRFDYGWAIDYGTHSHDMPQYYCDYLEIIGNCFDNAEMLVS